MTLQALAREFIAYWTTDRAYGGADVGCGMCGGIPHSTTCYVGRMDALLGVDENAKCQCGHLRGYHDPKCFNDCECIEFKAVQKDSGGTEPVHDPNVPAVENMND